jgi:uncharacterized protein YkuJ
MSLPCKEEKVKGKSIGILAATAILSSLPILGNSWEFIGFNRFRDAFYIDEQRVEVLPNGNIQVWTRLTVAKKSLFRHEMRKDLERAGKKVERVKYLEAKEQIDCRVQKIRNLELIYYDYQDRLVLKTSSPKSPWKLAAPGSLWYELCNSVCEKYKR